MFYYDIIKTMRPIKKLLLTLGFIFVVVFLLIQIRRGLQEIGLKIGPKESSLSPITPFPTWKPQPGAQKPTVTYENIPYKSTDKTRKVEIVGCVVDNSAWGMSYPKKEVEILNDSEVASETIKAFLMESSKNGWGGIPSREEVRQYEQQMKETVPNFYYKSGEVNLLNLTIDQFGTARVYFSKEIEAYGGGSARVACIYDSIDLTLKQFPLIKKVILCIENICADQKGALIFQP